MVSEHPVAGHVPGIAGAVCVITVYCALLASATAAARGSGPSRAVPAAQAWLAAGPSSAPSGAAGSPSPAPSPPPSASEPAPAPSGVRPTTSPHPVVPSSTPGPTPKRSTSAGTGTIPPAWHGAGVPFAAGPPYPRSASATATGASSRPLLRRAAVGPEHGVDRYVSRALIYWGLATLTISVGGLLLLGMGRRRW